MNFIQYCIFFLHFLFCFYQKDKSFSEWIQFLEEQHKILPSATTTNIIKTESSDDDSESSDDSESDTVDAENEEQSSNPTSVQQSNVNNSNNVDTAGGFIAVLLRQKKEIFRQFGQHSIELDLKYETLYRQLSNQKCLIHQNMLKQVEERIRAIDEEMVRFRQRAQNEKINKMQRQIQEKEKEIEYQAVSDLVHKVTREWKEFKITPFELSFSEMKHISINEIKNETNRLMEVSVSPSRSMTRNKSQRKRRAVAKDLQNVNKEKEEKSEDGDDDIQILNVINSQSPCSKKKKMDKHKTGYNGSLQSLLPCLKSISPSKITSKKKLRSRTPLLHPLNGSVECNMVNQHKANKKTKKRSFSDMNGQTDMMQPQARKRRVTA